MIDDIELPAKQLIGLVKRLFEFLKNPKQQKNLC